ncbi:hypothetical protein [Gordonia sp. CPCC 205333]|uniref:hypothetical protein n=1 Tax=Gordonia sp. CPCC 205333 TaxID=3140790 RepID=UPI003AF3C275
MTFNMGEVAPAGQQPFPALTAPQAVVHATLAETTAMAKEAARRHARTPQYLILPLPVALLFWLAVGREDGTSGLVTTVVFVTLFSGFWLLIAPRSLVPTFVTVLAGDATRPGYAFAASFDQTSMDIATHEISIARVPYHSIKHLHVLNSVVLVRGDTRVVFLFPRALLSPASIDYLRAAGVRVHA